MERRCLTARRAASAALVWVLAGGIPGTFSSEIRAQSLPDTGWRTASNAHGSGSTADSEGGLLPPPELTNAPQSAPASSENRGPVTLPNNEGQVWKEYDIRRFTQRHADEQKPEQMIVDWVLRETGTEMWFSDPLGILSANREKLRVYHRPEVQQLVGDIVDRFLRPDTESYMFGVQLVTLSSPNWRTKELPRLRSVPVQTPGVEAWLLSHEDAAVVLADLRKRTDFREYNSPNLLIRNGDTHTIRRMRPIAYMQSIVATGTAPSWSPTSGMGQIEEGFSLRLSPLMASDGRHLDAVIKIETQQVERLETVSVAAPTVQNPRQMSTVQVPHTCSWNLHERFHWPASEVLLISCGVVASPGPEQGNLLNLPKLTNKPPRSDALLFVDAKGRANDLVPHSQPQTPAQASGLNYRGRY